MSDNTIHDFPSSISDRRPCLTDSMNPSYFTKSAIGKAWEAQKTQPFGKDNLVQVYTIQPVFFHILLPVLKTGFLTSKSTTKLFTAFPLTHKFWKEYERVKHLDWTPLCMHNPNWQEQETIDETRVDLRLAMLFHYNMDLAAVHCRIGGNHVGAHRNPALIESRLKNLLDPKLLDELLCVLLDGCPAKFNAEGTHREFRDMLAYGNHPSVSKNLDKVMKTMNKEDRKDHVLTFPAWLAEFIPHLMLSPNGFVIKPGKNDCLVFDASFMLHMDSKPFNHHISLEDEADIIFGGAWTAFLISVYNPPISYPQREIYIFDDDVAAAFRQCKYHPNVVSAKAYMIGPYLFIPTGHTFGDKSSPPSFETMARARMALSKELSKGVEPVPEYSAYLSKVEFAPPPPPGFQFHEARADCYNPGTVIPRSGLPSSVAYNMHVDDKLYAAAGIEHMQWAMRCSIAGLQGILGENEPNLRSCQPDLDKFFLSPVSHTRRQLGYVIDTRTMRVTIPDDKRQELLDNLRTNWSSTSRQYSFLLSDAAEVLGLFIYLCRVCPWGIFLFHTLYNSTSQALTNNAARIWHSPEFCDAIAMRDHYSKHPTQLSRYRFFAQKVACAIYDAKSRTFLTPQIRWEVDFLILVLSDPITYKWESPIAHLIPREHDGKIYQDACPRGAGGFSSDFDFWWTVVWPEFVFQRTRLSSRDKCYIPINLLEYATLIYGLAGAIVSWEILPAATRPPHPMMLLWTDNMSARAWTKKVSGIKTPQGRSLARIFAHLLMFSDVGVKAAHIKGEDNVIADYLSRISKTHSFSSFTYDTLQTQFPWLTLSRRFVPSRDLLSLVSTALLRPSVNIPTTRVKLGLMTTEPNTSKQPFFGLS